MGGELLFAAAAKVDYPQALDLLDRFAPSAVDRLQIWKDARWAKQKG